MSVTPITRPLSGERMLGVEPRMARFVDSDWHRRLRLYTGRALTDVALIAEQTGRAGRLATRGQMVSPGIVSGLEAVLGAAEAPLPSDRVGVPAFHVSAGFGITVMGEDVFLPSSIVVPVQEVRVYAPAEAANASGYGSGTLGAATAADTSTLPRRLGGRLADYIANGVALPKAAILLLQPALVEVSGRPTLSSDPCEFDPSEESMEDYQIVDGCRLILYAWPDDWLPLPTMAPLRNQIAWSIFRREAGRAEGDPMPWEEVGVPLAVVGFDDSYRCTFIDRYAAARHGGRPKRRTALLPEDNPFLWQARMQQFAEHLADVAAGASKPETLREEFRFLPPAGPLPKEAVDARAGSSLFFPSYYTVAASPIPLEQIDAAIAASAGLAPYDLYTPDAVEVFVPVPQEVFDPDLLQIEKVSPEFQLEVDRTKAVRLDALERRNEIYRKADCLLQALKGQSDAPLATRPDPNAMPDEPTGKVHESDLEAAYGTTRTAAGYVSNEVARLKANWGATPAGEELPRIDTIGLEALIADLNSRAGQADDTVDAGFLRANTDIYRFRQLMMNNTVATRLATSPALAQIALGQSASATRDDLEKFLAAAKSKVVPPPTAAPASESPTGSNSVITHREAFLNAEFKMEKTKTVKPEEAAAVEKSTMAYTVSKQAMETMVFTPAWSIDEVRDASPIAGDTLPNFRTMSIAKRLEDPASTEARNYAVAARREAVEAVLRLTAEHIINMDDVPIPGIIEKSAEVVVQRTFGDLKEVPVKSRILNGIMNNVFDPLDANADEAEVFANGVRMVEQTISTMRAVEARIKLYRNLAAHMQTASGKINGSLRELDTRLKTAAEELASARQDVATTLALLADETARVRETNKRRDAVIVDHVTFLVYVRPRRAETVRTLPSRYLDPGLVPSPVPACLSAQEDVPPDIAAVVRLFRDAPVSWFPRLEAALEKLNRLEHLRNALQISRLQAQASMAVVSYVQQEVQASSGRLAAMIQKSYVAQQEKLTVYRTARSQFDLTLVANRTWQETFEYARHQLSVGDLMDGQHGTASLSRAASNEMEDVAKIAACICARAGDVLPVIRLAWAEAIGQYDGPVNLRDLGSLPRWPDVPYVTRHEFQALADWLYGRVNPAVADAVAAIGDLIRVALLVASHAPVNRLITGTLTHPAPVVPGGRLRIQVDHTMVQVGMQVLLYRQSAVVARGVVEDLGTGVASAHIVEALDATSSLEQGASVHFVAPGSPQYKTMVLQGKAVE